MPYARLDDRWDDHTKIRRAWRREPAAVALHAMAICYCNRHNNDGRLEADWLEEKLDLLPVKPAQRDHILATLLDLRLLERDGDEHFRVHDYLDWNRSKAQREALAEQGRRGGYAKAQAAATDPDSDGSGPGSSRGLAVAKPSPSEGSSTPTPTPTPTPETSSSGASGADVKVTDEHRRLCTLLRDLAVERNPKFKVKSRDRWLTDMRLLEGDGNTPADIECAIHWVFRDDFWGGVIQSPASLREHFPRVWDRMSQADKVVSLRDEKRERQQRRMAALDRLANNNVNEGRTA